MHPNILKDRFLELRAKNVSLARISAEIGVSKNTLIDWNHQFQPRLRALRELELEALQKRLLNSHEVELARLNTIKNRLEAELDRRGLSPILGLRGDGLETQLA